MSNEKRVRILAVRHALTDGNLQSQVFGGAELSINTEGEYQAKVLARWLSRADIDVVYTSPMVRCLQTAFILLGDRLALGSVDDTQNSCLQNQWLVQDRRIIERDYGEKEGAPFAEVDYDRFWNSNNEIKYVGAEDLAAVRARVQDFLSCMRERHCGQTVLCVTHGSVIRVMRGILVGGSFCGDYTKLDRTDNCEVLEFWV